MDEQDNLIAKTDMQHRISAIVPTIGRPEALRHMLDSLCEQTERVSEVIIADASLNGETAAVVVDRCWQTAGLVIRRIAVQPPNAVRQRQAAIRQATGDLLLLLDDDVVLERDCVMHLLATLENEARAVAVMADFNNQTWPMPTRAWRFYLRVVLGLKDGTWQGRVVGPLLRFGYNPAPRMVQPLEWCGTCNTLVRQSAYDICGGFSDFFLHRCTTNEDVDLGLKLARVGRILFCPAARLSHHQAAGGRVPVSMAAEDDIYNRYLVLRHTLQQTASRSFGSVFVFLLIETASNFLGCLQRGRFEGFCPRLWGRLRGTVRAIWSTSAARGSKEVQGIFESAQDEELLPAPPES